jgi:hypothetical protein
MVLMIGREKKVKPCFQLGKDLPLCIKGMLPNFAPQFYPSPSQTGSHERDIFIEGILLIYLW